VLSTDGQWFMVGAVGALAMEVRDTRLYANVVDYFVLCIVIKIINLLPKLLPQPLCWIRNKILRNLE